MTTETHDSGKESRLLRDAARALDNEVTRLRTERDELRRALLEHDVPQALRRSN